MLILALETATIPGSVALARDGEVIGEIELPRDRYISEALLPAVDDLLGHAGVGLKDLDILALAIGPGSFTGLRVGLATMKGLAIVLGVPIAPVSSLGAVAAAVSWRGGGVVRAVIDAGRGDVFGGVFRAEAGRVETIEEEKRIRWADFWTEVRSGEIIAGLVPESERARAKDRGALVDPLHPSAGGVARRAFDRIARGIASPKAMDVVSIRYLKPSWAEEVL
ncbi:MAG: tRNA (adenosine(37)-N6)-threonylcarbamoyltransferase complex dimerization subunit type 1 TsaB, partial [Nitrospirae bacterium]|nr:tRNA (adenosine(37)-N6)-threonylcarbamoyltransferase complex dimerization subunit type 1 TsaB [Nitrospirota bacterium]